MIKVIAASFCLLTVVAPQAHAKDKLGEYANHFKGPVFPKGVAIYDGPPRFESKPLLEGLGPLSYAEDEIKYPLTKSESNREAVIKSSTNKTQGDLYWPKLDCTYRSDTNKDVFRSFTFWYHARPEIKGNDKTPTDQLIKYIGQSSLNADIAVERCPATWGEAMTIIWGPNAWEEKKALYAEASEKKRQREYATVNTQTLSLEQKINTNATPTKGDILGVVMWVSMNATYDQIKLKSQNNGENFWVYKEVDGKRNYIAEVFMNIRNVSCDQFQGKHVCKYEEATQISEIKYGKYVKRVNTPIRLYDRTATFYWGKDGLHTDGVIVTYFSNEWDDVPI